MELVLIRYLLDNRYYLKNLYILKDFIALSRLHKKNSISLIERIVQSFLWEKLNLFFLFIESDFIAILLEFKYKYVIIYYMKKVKER